MPRKRFPSDKKTTVIRATKTRVKDLKKRSKKDNETLFVTTDKALASYLDPKDDLTGKPVFPASAGMP